MYYAFNGTQLKMSTITEQGALSFPSINTKLFTEKEDLQPILKSIFYNHSILEHHQFVIYLKLMYEYIGLDPPVVMGDYLITDQHSGANFNSFLTSLLTAIEEKSRGGHPCKVM